MIIIDYHRVTIEYSVYRVYGIITYGIILRDMVKLHAVGISTCFILFHALCGTKNVMMHFVQFKVSLLASCAMCI